MILLCYLSDYLGIIIYILQEKMEEECDYEDDRIAEEAVYSKCQNPQLSGYFEEGFQDCRDFRQIPEYHFRIEDPQEIIELNLLYEKSQPITTGFNMPGVTSSEFYEKCNDLLKCLDNLPTPTTQTNNDKIEQAAPQQNYYTLRQDEYDADKALEAAYNQLQITSLNKKLESLKIQEIKFKPRLSKDKNIMKDEQELNRKMKRLRITDDYQF